MEIFLLFRGWVRGTPSGLAFPISQQVYKHLDVIGEFCVGQNLKAPCHPPPWIRVFLLTVMLFLS